MQPNDTAGGDGTNIGPNGEEPIEKAAPLTGDVSGSTEELNAKIEAELGLPHTEVQDDTTDTSKSESEDITTTDETTDDTDTQSDADTNDSTTDEVITQEVIPSDEELFIEVEDANGNTFKISKIEDLPEDFEAKSNRQGLEILHQLDKLETKIAERDASLAAQAEREATQKAQDEQFAAWDAEIESLSKDKRIDLSDQERISKVFEHISKINEARVKAGNPNLITSFEDGLDKYERVEAEQQANDKLKQDNDRAKLKSSLLTGSGSTTATVGRPYVSGSARSIDDIII